MPKSLYFAPAPLDAYDTIYLAPHLDDAALSSGGHIADQCIAGQRVLVATIMAGDPAEPDMSDYVRSLHDRWQLATDAAARRRDEDIAACKILGADYVHLTVPDCIYRTDPQSGAPLYLSDDDIFGDVAPAEAYLLDQLTGALASLPQAGHVVTLLGVGHHVDHLLVRQASEKVFGGKVASKTKLVYAEDYPYAQEPGAVESALTPSPAAWQARSYPISNDAQFLKIEAILAFRSQLSTFFTDRTDLERQVLGYMAQVGGERLWRRA